MIDADFSCQKIIFFTSNQLCFYKRITFVTCFESEIYAAMYDYMIKKLMHVDALSLCLLKKTLYISSSVRTSVRQSVLNSFIFE